MLYGVSRMFGGVFSLLAKGKKEGEMLLGMVCYVSRARVTRTFWRKVESVRSK